MPAAPGVYRFFDADGEVVYVGKAKDLRRRLSQYRNAGRGRRDKKPRLIVKDAATFAWQALPTELDASLEELRLIQSLRPRHNVANAFDFLYPFVGLHRAGRAGPDLAPVLYVAAGAVPRVCLPRRLPPARRPRWPSSRSSGSCATWPTRSQRRRPAPRSARRARRHRRLPPGAPSALPQTWDLFFRGDDDAALGDLSLRLLEKPSARAKAAEIQADLETLRTFYDCEARPLRDAVRHTGFAHWPVPQPERDPLFMRFRSGPRRDAGDEGGRGPPACRSRWRGRGQVVEPGHAQPRRGLDDRPSVRELCGREGRQPARRVARGQRRWRARRRAGPRRRSARRHPSRRRPCRQCTPRAARLSPRR
ncbi:MAG: nucleotide excision repair endonuclease [Myxococcota bacterium]